MIKVGIIGAHTPPAGELIRLLIHHPEVDIVSLHSSVFSGRQASACHYGLIGESLPNFTDKINPAKLDIIFLADDSRLSQEIVTRTEEWPELRLVDLSSSRLHNREANGMEYGLSEANRKPLVRGARMAAVASSAAAASLIALYPLALHLLLNSDIEIKAALPSDMLQTTDPEEVAGEIAAQLAKAQSSFSGTVNVKFDSSHEPRGMKVVINFKGTVSASELAEVYDSVYDDHSFTFTGLSDAEIPEVSGTQKCIVAFNKPTADTVQLTAVADPRMRGGAGDAVHLLNLLFALDEKVGLHFKPSAYASKITKSPGEASWFA